MIERIDLVGRVAYGVLCIAGMAGVALPVLFVAGIAGGFMFDGGKALAVWLGSWGAAVFAAGLFTGIVYAAWPLAADWIMEWPGYALGFAVGGAGLGLMALLLFAVEAPLYISVPVPLAATFAAGFAVAGWLPGARVSEPPRRRPVPLRRRTGTR